MIRFGYDIMQLCPLRLHCAHQLNLPIKKHRKLWRKCYTA